MRIEMYLDQIMRKHGFKRDKQLAEWLGVTPTAVCNYRNGDRSMDNEKCVKVALELDIDPVKVIMATDLDKAERTGQHSIWELFTQKMAATAATIAIASAVTLFLTPHNAEAAQLQAPLRAVDGHSLYYVKLTMDSVPPNMRHHYRAFFEMAERAPARRAAQHQNARRMPPGAQRSAFAAARR